MESINVEQWFVRYIQYLFAFIGDVNNSLSEGAGKYATEQSEDNWDLAFNEWVEELGQDHE